MYNIEGSRQLRGVTPPRLVTHCMTGGLTMSKACTLKSYSMTVNPSLGNALLCSLSQMAYPFCASVSSLVKRRY